MAAKGGGKPGNYKLISIGICRVDKDKSIILCQETDTSGIWVGKSSLKEMSTFIIREISFRVEVLAMQSLSYKGYICHAFKQKNGLCVCVITDDKYPPRAAHGLIRSVFTEFESRIKDKEWKKAGNGEVSFYQLSGILQNYKNPPADKMQMIEAEIEASKKIVVQSIEHVMKNMEQLDTLVAKSEDLSETSRMFYKKSKKLNRCCVVL